MAKGPDPNGNAEQQTGDSCGVGNRDSLKPQEFDPDHPLSAEHGVDRLGFQSVAKKLASSLLAQSTNHGLVVSIEGVWGSGKSSLVSLLIQELEGGQQDAPEVVRFEPWLVGDRDGMLAELMSDLALAVDSIRAPEIEEEEKLKAEREELVGLLRAYASKLSRQTAPIARLAALLGVPGGEVAVKVLESASELAAAPTPAKTASQVKEELTEGLQKLGRGIVVVIDDLDRLEPREAVEIMRLIRAVADFPNVTYLLCYDPKVLADSLQNSLSLKDGTAFLEKMVQVRFNVPQPEAFDLRKWLREECLEFFSSTNEKPLSDDQIERLFSVCDVEGGLLETPRDVVRALNAVRLYWPPISDKVDFADLVWLQMVKINNEDLYSWIERYMVECTAVYEGATVADTGKVEFAEWLRKHMVEGNIGSARSMWTFKDFLPGINPGSNVEDKDRLFNLGVESEKLAFESDRRLGSSQHSRYYFAFSKPTAALEDAELYRFISLAEAEQDLEHLCISLIQEKRPQGGTKFDVLLDRLNRPDETDLPDSAVPAILMALANCMDQVGEIGQWGVRWSWHPAGRLFKHLLARLSGYERSKSIREVFSSGKAIGWLMSNIIREEVFAHGRFGDEAEPEENRLLSPEELDEAISSMLHRFKSTDRNRIIDAPALLRLMFSWLQAGDEVGVLDWVEEQQSTDEGFLKLLSACRGWMHSDRTYHPLNRRDLKRFLDFDKALERLRRISQNTEMTQNKRELANELLAAAELGRDD